MLLFFNYWKFVCNILKTFSFNVSKTILKNDLQTNLRKLKNSNIEMLSKCFKNIFRYNIAFRKHSHNVSKKYVQNFLKKCFLNIIWKSF